MARYKVLNAIRLAQSLDAQFSEREHDQITRYVTGQGIVFTGLLKRGKSTLINSLIGRQVLPSGRAPETWCPVSLGSASRPSVKAVLSSKEQVELFVAEKDLPEVLARDGELRSRGAHHVVVAGEFRLPDGLVLIDTQGADEAGAIEGRPIWRSVGAQSAVLISSFPPGVGSADRELYESLREYFGSHVLVILKSTDSGVGVSDLEKAATVWADLGVRATLVEDSRELRVGAWGTGDFSELETQIATLDETAVGSLEELAAEIEQTLVAALMQIRVEILASPGPRDTKTLRILQDSFDMELPGSISNLVSRLYVELFEARTDISKESITALFMAAHRGSVRAQDSITAMWSDRLVRGAGKRTENSLSSTSITTLLELLRSRPRYSTYDAQDAVECTIEDIEVLERIGQLSDDNMAILSSGVMRCVERTTQLTEINRLLNVRLAQREQHLLVQRVVDEIATAYESGESQHLEDIATRLTPQTWKLSNPSTFAELKTGVEALLRQVETLCKEIAATTLVSRRMFESSRSHKMATTALVSCRMLDTSRSHKVAELRSVLQVQSAALGVATLMSKVVSKDVSENAQRLKDLIHGDRKLVEWVDYHFPAVSDVEGIRTSAARRDAIFGLVALAILTFGAQGLGVWFTLTGLVGTATLAFFGYKRREQYPIEALSFERFSSGVKLNLLQRRQFRQNIAVVATVLLVSVLGTYSNDALIAAVRNSWEGFISDERVTTSSTAPSIRQRQIPSAMVLADQFSRQQIELGPAQFDNLLEWRLETARLGSRSVPRTARALLCPKRLEYEAGKSRQCAVSSAIGTGPNDEITYTFQFRLKTESAAGTWYARALLRPGETLVGSAEVELIAYEDAGTGQAQSSSGPSLTTTSTTTVNVSTTTTKDDLSSGAPSRGEDTGRPRVAAREYWIDDTPLALPLCDGSYISIVMSTSGEGASRYVRATPGASYLRTDITCPSLNPFFSSGSLRGQPIYSVFYGPFGNRYQAQQQCLDLGHTSKSNCYVAPLTSNEGDRSSRFGPLDP